jgi:hypothetical protein
MRSFITCLFSKYNKNDQVSEDETGRACSTNGNAYRILVGKPDGKRPLGRRRRRCVDNIKMDLREVGWDAWIGFIWLRIGASGVLS